MHDPRTWYEKNYRIIYFKFHQRPELLFMELQPSLCFTEQGGKNNSVSDFQLYPNQRRGIDQSKPMNQEIHGVCRITYAGCG